MKKLILALFLTFVSNLAFAQCNGIFPNNTLCGNTSGASAPAKPTVASSFPFTLVIGTTVISGGTSGRILYDNAGVLGETATLPTGFFANPSSSIGLTVVNGSAMTAMRSDAAPALSQSIAPTWTGLHTWSQNFIRMTNGTSGTVFTCNSASPTCAPFQGGGGLVGSILAVNNFTSNTSGLLQSTLVGTSYASGTAGAAGVTGNAIATGASTPVVWAFNGAATCGAASGAACFGAELYVQVQQAGASATPLILELGDDGIAGHVGSQFILVRYLGNGASSGINPLALGINFANNASYPIIATTGTLIGITGPSASGTIGIDLSNATWSSCAFKSTGFCINATGAFNGFSVGTVTSTSGTILVANGTNWNSVSPSGDVASISSSGAFTLASPGISAGGPTGSATVAPIITYDAKGRLTAVSSATITPAVGNITGLGTGVATWLATPSSANLAAAVTDEVGSGALVFATSPQFTTDIRTPVVAGGTSTTSSLSLKSTTGVGTTNADIIFLVGNNGATEAMRVLNSGNVGIGSNNPQAPLHINKNTVQNATPPFSAPFYISDVDSGSGSGLTALITDAYNSIPFFFGRRTNGTSASKTATASGDLTFIVGGGGYYTSGGTAYTNMMGSLRVAAIETYTSSAQGTKVYVETTPAGSTTAATTMTFHGSGGVSIGNTTDPGSGSLQMNTKIFAPNLSTTTAALGAALCWTTTTGEFQRDTNAGGCLVSIRAAKNLLGPIAPSSALQTVMRLDAEAFTYKSGYGDGGQYEQVGFIAEQVATVDERLAARSADGTLTGVRYMQMTAILVAAIKQLKADNDNLYGKLSYLQEVMQLKRDVK